MRNTQKIAIWTAIKNMEVRKKSNILQVSTGEGKSLVIVGIAYILANLGFNVDIATSSSVLAIRDAD